MSAFLRGLNFGFMQGIFNNMFGFGMYGGFNPFNTCCMASVFNMTPVFMTPRMNFGNFYQYQLPTQQFLTPSFNIFGTNSSISAFPSYNFMNFPIMNMGDSFINIASKRAGVKPEQDDGAQINLKRQDGDFDKMMDYIFEREGGYNPDDCGQPGNYGVLQSSYDKYRKQKGLPTQPVKLLTKEEARDLYYQNYYLASGADKISDPILALQVFDAAVNMGVGTAKQLRSASGDNVKNFEELRIARYESIAANNPSKRKYLEGWKRRVTKTHNFAVKEFSA